VNTLRFIAVATVAFAAGGAAVFVLRPAPAPTVIEVARTADDATAPEQPPPPRAAKRTVIPKREIYAIGPEDREGFAHCPLPEPHYEKAQEDMRRLGGQIGSANVFLVPGFIPADVLMNAREVLLHGASAGYIYGDRDYQRWRDKDDNPAPLWVFVMLTHSGLWKVREVVCEANRIRFSYTKHPLPATTEAVIVPYLYWFRLPAPEREDYLFELFDCDKGEVMLSRRQFLEPARPPQPPPPFDPNIPK
jgi:hypothetical protein